MLVVDGEILQGAASQVRLAQEAKAYDTAAKRVHLPNLSGIVPLDHRVLVLHDPVEEKTRGGIILPDSELDKQKFATTNATVIAVGALAWSEAKHDAAQFEIDAVFPEAGSRVKVGRYTGDQHKGADGKEYTILNDSDVIALLTEEE